MKTIRLCAATLLMLALQASASLSGEGWWAHGYATLNLAWPDLQSDRSRRSSIDLERVTFEPGLRLGENLVLEAEIEFEHGGTGAAFEFEAQEEFGEFEQEIEKGGEVLLERFHLGWQAYPGGVVRAGRIPVPFGTLAAHDEPGDYLSVHRPFLETWLVPGLWTALGADVSWNGRRVRAALAATEGLDGSLFSNFRWAGGADQQRFETARLDGFALSGKLEVSPIVGLWTGASLYTCDVAANRPKDDMQEAARVWIYEAHAEWERGPVRARVQAMQGRLGNATELGRRNKTLPNVLATPRTGIGSMAQGLELEFGYDVLSIWSRPWGFAHASELWAWGGVHLSDAMAEVEAGTSAHALAGRRAWTGGLSARLAKAVLLKGQCTLTELGAGSATAFEDRLLELGLGLEF